MADLADVLNSFVDHRLTQTTHRSGYPKKSNAFGQPNDQMPFEGVWFELVSGPGGFLMAEASPIAGWFINVYNMYHGSHPWMMTGVP